MIGPADEELLHRALDRTLSADEAERLRARLAADPALRARAESLERLAALVDGVGHEESPAGFSDRVMAVVSAVPSPRPAWHRRLASLGGIASHQLFPWFAHHSRQTNNTSDAYRRAGMAGGGVIVAKKALWGIAGLAVIAILVVVYFNGTRSVDQGAQGTIGAADRYRGAQPETVNAKAGDAQAFLQSDTFDKMIKDPNVRKMLENRAMCQALADTDVMNAAASKALQEALGDGDVANALGRGGVIAAIQNAGIANAIQSPLFVAAFRDAGAIKAFQSADVQEALKDASNLAAINREAQAALKAGAQSAAMQREARSALSKYLNNAAFAAVMADASLTAAIGGKSAVTFKALTQDQAFLTVAAHQESLNRLMALSSDAAVQQALGKSPMLSAMLGDAALHGALTNSYLIAAMQSGVTRASFSAALQDEAAMNRALQTGVGKLK